MTKPVCAVVGVGAAGRSSPCRAYTSLLLRRKKVSLVVALVATAACATSPAAWARGVRGITYDVEVTSSFDPVPFSECFRFDRSGSLSIDGLGTLTFDFDRLGRRSSRWQAVRQGGLGFAFHGFGNRRRISGDAIDELGNTYVFRGRRNRNCTIVPLETTRGNMSWWMEP